MSKTDLWPFYYKFGDTTLGDPQGRAAVGLQALKRELIYQGFGDDIVWNDGLYDKATALQVKLFQVRNSIEHDGVIGPETAKALFTKRISGMEHRFGIQPGWLLKLVGHLSEYNPVAHRPSQKEGLVLIDLDFHPDVRLLDACDPEWALEWAAARLLEATKYCGDDQGGLAAWDIGRMTAREWVDAGKPVHGGEPLRGQDSFARATNFVQSVLIR